MSSEEWGTAGHIGDAEAAAIIYAPGRDREMETRVWKHLATCDECDKEFAMLPQDYSRAGLQNQPRLCRPCATDRRRKARRMSR